MPERTKAAMVAWHEAEDEARAAENLLYAAWQDHASRKGPAVPAHLIDEVARLRDRANDKLMVALSALRR
jgi:hypothetical protein